MKEIDLNQTIHQLATAFPELPTILHELGFSEIVKPGMLNTVGRFMTLKQGCAMRKIDLETVKKRLLHEGFTFKED